MRATLPPMNALRAFEAVARCGSLNAAAAELGVVRGAVRQQLAVISGGRFSCGPAGVCN
jgi:LysR family glycine cleavage system transcriptional activator